MTTLVDRHVIRKSDSRCAEIDHAAWLLTKNLWNAANYTLRQPFSKRQLRRGIIATSGLSATVQTRIEPEQVKEVRITPQIGCWLLDNEPICKHTCHTQTVA